MLQILVIFMWVCAAQGHFAVDYFGYRGVKHICYMSCETPTNTMSVANSFIKNYMRVSVKNIHNADVYDLQVYLNQWTVEIGVFIEGSCNQTINVLAQASRGALFDASHIWLIVDNIDGNATVAVDDALQRMNLSVDADVVVATDLGDRYELMDIFNFGKIQGNNLERKYLGTWSEESGLNVSASTFKYYDRWDFHNLTLRAVTVVGPDIIQLYRLVPNSFAPIFIWVSGLCYCYFVIVLGRPKAFEPEMLTSLSYTKGISVFTKTAAQVLQPIRKIHNMRFNYTVVGRWIGTVTKNASLAVMNTLYWHEQDIACTSARIFSNWLNWVDICHPPVGKIESRFFYLIPDKGIGNYENRFLTPLSPAVWWCAVAAGIFCACVLAVSAVVEKRPGPAVYAVLSVHGAVCQQAYEEGPQIIDEQLSSQGGRLTMLVIGMTSMLLYNYYTSSVVSWLLSAAPPTLQDIDGLINSDFELIFEDIGYTRGWFEDAGFFYYSGYKNPKEDVLRQKKVTHAKRYKDIYQPVEYGIELIKSGDYAYHTEPYTAYQSISRTFDDAELCRLGSLPMIKPSPTYVMTQKRSPYKQFFNWSLMRLKERGHITAIQARIAGFIATCSGSTPRALALGQAAPAFGLLVGSAILSLIIMFGEIVWFRWNKKPIKGRSRNARETNGKYFTRP